MECNKWQETGLLYLSQELDGKSVSEYLAHIDVCSVCREEIAAFDNLQKNVVSVDMLYDSPSELIDKKIITACSGKPAITGFNLFGVSWVKRTVYSSLFLVVGLGAGIYFAPYIETVMNPAQSGNGSAIYQQSAPAAQASVQQSPVLSRKDSLASHKSDSLTYPDDHHMLAKPIDPSSQQGIVTVDLNKE